MLPDVLFARQGAIKSRYLSNLESQVRLRKKTRHSAQKPISSLTLLGLKATYSFSSEIRRLVWYLKMRESRSRPVRRCTLSVLKRILCCHLYQKRPCSSAVLPSPHVECFLPGKNKGHTLRSNDPKPKSDQCCVCKLKYVSKDLKTDTYQ